MGAKRGQEAVNDIGLVSPRPGPLRDVHCVRPRVGTWITCSIGRMARLKLLGDDDDYEAFERILLEDLEWTGTRAWVVSCTMRACHGLSAPNPFVPQATTLMQDGPFRGE